MQNPIKPDWGALHNIRWGEHGSEKRIRKELKEFKNSDLVT